MVIMIIIIIWLLCANIFLYPLFDYQQKKKKDHHYMIMMIMVIMIIMMIMMIIGKWPSQSLFVSPSQHIVNCDHWMILMIMVIMMIMIIMTIMMIIWSWWWLFDMIIDSDQVDISLGSDQRLHCVDLRHFQFMLNSLKQSETKNYFNFFTIYNLRQKII